MVIYWSCRLYEEMKDNFGIELAIPSSEVNLVLDLSEWLTLASSSGEDIVIVLDALNQLNDGTGEAGMISYTIYLKHNYKWPGIAKCLAGCLWRNAQVN